MIRKFFASILILIFLFFSIPATILFGVYRTFLDENFYKGPLLNEVYDRVVPILIEGFYTHDKDILGRYFTKEELFEIVKRDIPPEVLSVILQDGFSQLERILEGGQQKKIILKFDGLREPGKKLTDNLIEIIFTQKIRPCEKGQYPKMSPVPSCIPKGYDVGIYRKRFGLKIEQNIGKIFTNIKPMELDATAIVQNVQMINVLNVAMQAFFGMIILLCFLILLVLWKPVSRGLKWLGAAFIIVSFEALVIYKMIPILSKSLKFQQQEIPQQYLDEAQAIANFIVNYYQKQIVYVVVAVFATGIIMIFAGYLLRHNSKK